MHLTYRKYHSIGWKSGLNKTGESELRTHIYYHLLHDYGCNITICLKFLLPSLTQHDRRYPQVASQNKLLLFLSCLRQASDDRHENPNYYMKPQQKVIAQHMLSFFALIFQNQFLGEDSSRCWHCYSYILLKNTHCGVAQLVECLPGIYKALGSIPSTAETRVVPHTYNLCTQVVDARRREVGGHARLHRELQASWDT